MGYKVGFLAGAATGFVLGSRAGRQRYEQIKGRSAQLWNSDSVQSAVSGAAGQVKAKAPSPVHGLVDKAVDAQAKAAHKADPTA